MKMVTMDLEAGRRVRVGLAARGSSGCSGRFGSPPVAPCPRWTRCLRSVRDSAVDQALEQVLAGLFDHGVEIISDFRGGGGQVTDQELVGDLESVAADVAGERSFAA